MRTAIVVLFVLVGAMVVDRFLAYGRREFATRENGATVAAPTDDASAAMSDAVHDLRARIDALERESLALRSAIERRPAATAVENAPVPAADPEVDFRNRHEGAILAIVADELERRELERRVVKLRESLRAYAREHGLTDVQRSRIEATVVEAQRRADAILARFAPGERTMDPSNPRASEWTRAWRELRDWRRWELGRDLDEQMIDALLRRLTAQALDLAQF